MLAELLDAAGNLQRLNILYLLHAHKEMCVCDLAEVLDLTHSALSQHLRKLRDKNMVKTRRKGQTIYYSLIHNPFTNHFTALFTRDEAKEQYAFALTGRK
ncbi:MAG: helix-turn-helix transcriptional regulator [Ignavibacteriales bacterium]|nr:helix-turn-helix transcriptional regulator [Ignavibacteriales bacterium]MBI3789016.1 helix-turn-helix transcriptional regulator [Ignavibacteriales bacterium]